MFPIASKVPCRLLSIAVPLAIPCGCARLPYTTRIIHEDRRVVVALQRELAPAGYSHPVQRQPAELVSILRGCSIRQKQRLPLRWFAEETAPKPLFRLDETQVLAGPLAEALQQAGTDERIHFELKAPGLNPAAAKDVVAGWMAVRQPWLYLSVDYFHVQLPTRASDPYDYNYHGTPAPLPGEYLLYFDPGRFWATDASGRHALDYRAYLASPLASERAGQRTGERP